MTIAGKSGARLANSYKKITFKISKQKGTLLITGSGSMKQTSFHITPSGCRIPPKTPNIITFTRVLNITIPYLTEAHSTYTATDFLQPHTTLCLEKTIPKARLKKTKTFSSPRTVSNTSMSKQASGGT